MTKLSRVLALLLSAVLILAACAACAGPQPPATSSTPPTSTTTTSSSQPQEPKNNKVVIINYSMAELPKAMDQQLHDKILADTGLDVEIVATSNDQMLQVLNLKLAANEQVDAWTGGKNWVDYKAEGLIAPLNEWVEKYPSVMEATPAFYLRNYYDKDGNLWCLGRISKYAAQYNIALRTDWQEKLGLKDPTTIEELESYLKAVRDGDPNENGKKDEIPMAGWTWSVFECFIPAYTGKAARVDSNQVFIDTDGKCKPIIFAAGFKDLVATFANWYKEGYVSKEFLQFMGDQTAAYADVIGVAAAWHSSAANFLYYMGDKDPEAEFKIIPPVKGPAGAWYQPRLEFGGGDGLYLSAKAKNPEGFFQFIEYLFSDKTNLCNTMYGLDAWKWVDKEKQTVEINPDYGTQYASSYGFFDPREFDIIPSVLDRYSKNVLTNSKVLTEYSKLGYIKDPDTGTFLINPTELSNKGVKATDVRAFITEGVAKFLTGERPVSDWEKFLDEAMNMGVGKYIDEVTAQYNASK